MVLLASTVTFLLALPLLHRPVAAYLAYVLNALDLDSAVQLARFSTYWQALRWICVLASILAEFCVLPWPIDSDRLRTFLLAWSFDLAIVVVCERFTSRSSRTRGSDPGDSPPGAWQDQDLATRNSVELDEARGKISLEKLDDLEEPYMSLVGFVLALAREWFEVAKGSRLLRRFSDACLPPAMSALLVRVSDWIPVTRAAAKAGDVRGEERASHYLDAKLDRANQILRRWPWFADTHVLVARANNLVSAPILFPACIILGGFFVVRVIPDPRPINGALVAVGLCGLSVILCVAVVWGRFKGCFESGRGSCKEEGVDEGAVPVQGAHDEDEDNLAVDGVQSGKTPQPTSVHATIIAGLPLPSYQASPALNSRRPPEVPEVDPAYEYERRAKKPRLQAPHPHELDGFNINGNNALRRRKQQQRRVLRFADVGRLHGRGRELVLTPFTNREFQAVPRPALERTLASAEPPSPRCSERSIDATECVHRDAEKSLAAELESESDPSAGQPFRDILNLNTPPPRKVEFAPIGLGDLHRSVAYASPAPSGFSLRDSEKLPMKEKETRGVARGWATVGEPDTLGAGPGEQEQEESLQHNKNKAHLPVGAGPGGGLKLVQGGRNAKDRKGKGKGKGKAPERNLKGGRGGERSWLVQMSEVRDLDVDGEDASSESSSASSGDTGDSEW